MGVAIFSDGVPGNFPGGGGGSVYVSTRIQK